MRFKILFRKYFEAGFWVCAVALTAFILPETDTHYSLCVFNMAGVNFCPGCGLGHSISYLLHGNIKASFSSHPLGILALIIIFYRIYKLIQLNLSSNK